MKGRYTPNGRDSSGFMTLRAPW